MKYPFVIFFRYEKYKQVDAFLSSNSSLLNCSIFITSDPEDIMKLHDANYQLLATYGDNKNEYEEVLNVLSSSMKKRCMHFEKIENVHTFNHLINNHYVSLCTLDRSVTRPTFSLFTSCYNSYEKILRAYNSLKAQTLKDWEWVIIDDSPDDKHFAYLRGIFEDDCRVRFYRRSKNNGSIGNVKNESVSLCRGKYVLELDHDDEILPFVLQESTDLFESQPEIGFIYMDFINIYENGNNFFYGDFICKGYGGYYCQRYNGAWRYVYVTPNINNITLSHLVCCPNHPRIWRRDLLMNIGNYCEYLPICDDYEILLRTAISTKMAKIPKIGYVQYMNNSNNNFSLIRNGEINRIGPNYISPIYYDTYKIHEKMKEFGAHEDEKYVTQQSQIWMRDPETYKHVHCNLLVNKDYDCQYCIVGLDSLFKNIDYIRELYKNERNDFLVLDNKCSIYYLWMKLDDYGFGRMKCYTLSDYTNTQLIQYFKTIYKSVDKSEIIDASIEKPKYNAELKERWQVINKYTSPSDEYLEIGVEYGDTYGKVHFTSKTGVDPDPKCNLENIQKLTSDDFFKTLFKEDDNDNASIDSDDLMEPAKMFDAIFIDGMHHCEVVLKDINNSIRTLSSNGTLFVDDIIPLNHNEQLKVPVRHKYENGILKYGEPWTGDVWKVIYHMLLNFSDKIDFKYYFHANHRGVAVIKIKSFFQISSSDIGIINGYDYFNHFDAYVSLLNMCASSH